MYKLNALIKCVDQMRCSNALIKCRVTAESGFEQMFDSRTVVESNQTAITVRQIEQL